MSSLRLAAKAFDQNLVLLIGAVALLHWLSGSSAVVIYALSFTYHLLNLHAYLFRQSDADRFLARSLLFRTVSMATLVTLMVPYFGTPMEVFALVPIVVGSLLHAAAVAALGMRRTYYGVELGALPPEQIRTFPYDMLRHPMELGAVLQFAGAYFLFPEFTSAYPYLVLGHLLLTTLTALVEQLQWHFDNRFFSAVVSRFPEERRSTIDGLRDWSLEHFRSHLHQDCSMHRYVKTLPSEVIAEIDRVRYAEEVMAPVQAAFPQSKVVPLPMTDELYISRYNIDRGGDQGLFDKHHDGNLRFFPAASVVRSLIYLSSDDELEVVFDSSGTSAVMKTYDFGLLDFHKELHWVNGTYDPKNPPRILLKCNYYIDHSGLAVWRRLGIFLNIAIFYVVKAAMEYSKSPKTLPQRCIGFVCNVFRRLNNVSPAAPIAIVVTLVAITLRVVYWQLSQWF